MYDLRIGKMFFVVGGGETFFKKTQTYMNNQRKTLINSITLTKVRNCIKGHHKKNEKKRQATR